LFLDLKGHRLHLSIVGSENCPLSQTHEMYQQNMTMFMALKDKNTSLQRSELEFVHCSNFIAKVHERNHLYAHPERWKWSKYPTPAPMPLLKGHQLPCSCPYIYETKKCVRRLSFVVGYHQKVVVK
jgi:hypothetical protein